MKAAVLGTGRVGLVNPNRLVELGHEPLIGTRRPQTKVVKTLNTVAAAKRQVIEILKEFGWIHLLDLGVSPPRAARKCTLPCGCASEARRAAGCSTSNL